MRRACASLGARGQLNPAVTERFETVRIRMRDGVRLATDVYLPRAASRHRVPVVVSRGPYGRDEPMTCQAAIAATLRDAGYAVLVQDSRGRYASEGAADPFAVTEMSDAADTFDWIEAQPWSSDAAITIGDSYYGWLQWAAAASGHRLLRGIVPGMTSTRIADDWMYDHGTFCLSTMCDWAAVAWSTRTNDYRERDWSGRPLGELVTSWTGPTPATRHLRAWMRHESEHPYWRTGAFGTVRPQRIGIPALHLGGWWDVFRRGQLRDWQDARRAHAGQYLAVRCTDHHHVELREDPWLPPVEEDERDYAARYVGMILPFLELATGRTERAPATPVRYEVAYGGWREADRWPPPGLARLPLHLVDGARALVDAHGGGLSRRAERAAQRVSWLHDPSRLVPSGEDDPFAMLVQTADESGVQTREDVLTFSTPPLDHPLELVGASELHLRGSIEPGRQFVAKLSDVFLDGRALRITEGVRTVAAGAAGETATVLLRPCAYRVRAGHSLRLEIAASHFPRYLPGAPGDAWRDLGEPLPYAITVGGRDGSRLDLSVASSWYGPATRC